MKKSNPTVEKIGGTSMLKYAAVRDNIFAARNGEDPYGRVFVVSAYAGMTNYLLSDKKTSEPGVFALFQNDPAGSAWQVCLDNVLVAMLDINSELFAHAAELQAAADGFITERVDGVRQKLLTVGQLLETGFFAAENSIPQCGEMLASLGEAHSAWNLAKLIEHDLGYKTDFVDLTGWQKSGFASRDAMFEMALDGVDTTQSIAVVSGYSRSKEGILQRYGRGYTEMTMSDLAVKLKAREAVIHKEFHLSSADPRLVGTNVAQTLGATDYDIADQLSHYGMEAIHPEAARGMREANIPIRVKNTFEPDHTGTLISCSEDNLNCVEIIASRDDVVNIDCFDHGMLGNLPETKNYIQELITDLGGEYVSSTHSANSVGIVATLPLQKQDALVEALDENWPDGECESESVAQIGVLGRSMDIGCVLRDGIDALLKGDVPVLAASTGHRDIEVRFVVPAKHHDQAVKQLHAALVERDEVKLRRKIA